MTAFTKFVAGQVLTAAQVNGQWVSFTPSWTNLTLGSGSAQNWAYCYVPGGLWITGATTLGTGGGPTGAVSMTLPDSATSRTSPPSFTIGHALYVDINGTDFLGMTAIGGNDTLIDFRTDSYTSLSSTVPFTWAANDIIRGTIVVPI
jgi:hypothetical protein